MVERHSFENTEYHQKIAEDLSVRLESVVKELDQCRNTYETEISMLKEKIVNLEDERNALQVECEDLNNNIDKQKENHNEVVNNLTEEIEELNTEIRHQKDTIIGLERKLKTTSTEYLREIQTLKKQKDRERKDFLDEIKDKKIEIETYKVQNYAEIG